MDRKNTYNLWQLGLGAGMLFGFGSNAMEVFFPDLSLRAVVKAALLVISGFLVLAGYAQVRKVNQDAQAGLTLEMQ